MNRSFFALLGVLSVGMGVVGAILPVLPSTCFFILAAYCFGKSSYRLESWILNHPKFGYSVRGWRETKSISRVGKVAACSGMLVGLIFLIFTPLMWSIKLAGVVFIIGSAIFILTRPTLKSPGAIPPAYR